MITKITTGYGLYSTSDSFHLSDSGILRWDATYQRMEINNFGNEWRPIHNNHQEINLNPEVIVVIEWAKKKMEDEKKLKELCDKHPGLKDAKDAFEIMWELTREH